MSYAQLDHVLRQSRNFLADEIGLVAGDAVAVLMENKPELLAVSWAAWSAGLKTVPLDIKRDALDTKLYKLHRTDAKALVVRMDQADADEVQRLKDELPGLRVVELAGEGQYFEMVADCGAGREEPGAASSGSNLDTDCLILFTSGTTARPKGARLTPRSLWANAAQIVHWLRMTEDDRFHILLPLHHINSTTFSLATILAGGTIVLSPRYSKSRFWKTMAEHGATLSSVVPTIAYDMLSEQKRFDEHKDRLAQVSRIQLGSAPVQVSVVEKFYERYRIPLVQGYGSTETSLRCTGVPYGLDDGEYLEIVRSNSIGEEMLYTNVAILDAKCRRLPEDAEGEICIRGPIVTRGYLKDPEETRKAFRGGWFHSGDLGYWKKSRGRNLIFIKGRMKEIIIKGGVNVSPLAVENAVLKAFPGIEFCYALGIPHPRYGEEVGIVVAGDAAALSDLAQAVKARKVAGLSAYECPAVFITDDRDALPKTSTGKIQRVKAKQQYAERLEAALDG